MGVGSPFFFGPGMSWQPRQAFSSRVMGSRSATPCGITGGIWVEIRRGLGRSPGADSSA
jgi:hypothetical protein